MDRGKKVRKKKLLLRSGVVGLIASLSTLALVSPASAATSPTYSGTLITSGGNASFRAGFRSILTMTEGAANFTVRDTVADGYCVHGSVTYNVTGPDPTYDSPNVCGSGTYRTWPTNLARYAPLAVNGMLVKACKTINNAPDPCTTRYIDNPLR